MVDVLSDGGRSTDPAHANRQPDQVVPDAALRCVRIVHKAHAVVRPRFRLNFRGGIHGLPHWSRVWHHGRALAHAMNVDPAILAWFAFLHDSQRQHDGRDPDQGRRAADFATRCVRRA
jgi:HD superfamily phosphodiesterase